MSIIPLYIGVMAKDEAAGIYRADFDAAAGALSVPILAAQQAGAFFLANSSDGKVLFSIINDIDDGEEKSSGVISYKINAENGDLTTINASAVPDKFCHIALDQSGKWLLGASYSQGSVGILPVAQDGSIGALHKKVLLSGSSVDPRRQTAPHSHQIIASPDNRQILVTDLGIDKVMIYDFDAATGNIDEQNSTFIRTAAGAGPRHSAFHSSGNALYTVNEINNTITVSRKEGSELTPIQAISTLPAGYEGDTWTAEIILSADEKFVYATNRGQNSIAVFGINEDYTLTLLDIVETGNYPQHIIFSPCGKWLLCGNMKGTSLDIFRVNQSTGIIERTTTVELPGQPMCLAFPLQGE